MNKPLQQLLVKGSLRQRVGGKTTAEVGKKKMSTEQARGRRRNVGFLRQPEGLLRAQKPARQGKGTLLLQYFTYFFALDGVTIPEIFGKAWVGLLGR